MFDNLIESKASKQKRAGGALLSAAVHAVLITGAVIGTLHASQELSKPKAEKVEFVQVKKDEPPPPKEEPKPPPPEVVMKAPPPKGFQVLTAPIKIPMCFPTSTFPRRSRTRKTSRVRASRRYRQGRGRRHPDSVERQPDLLRLPGRKAGFAVPGQSGTTVPRHAAIGERGRGSARPVSVDTTGRAEMASFKVLKSTHELFTNAVKSSLPQMRFYPAEVGGRKVKQLVQMPFQFSLTKSE